jgi:hypothetical protein
MRSAIFGASILALCFQGTAAKAQTIVRTLGASDDRYVPSVAGSLTGWKASIPPMVESGPVVASGGGYCFQGEHPTTLADSDTGEPETWHEEMGPHKHTYAPLDLRLFAYVGKCYQFTGDPSDFGQYRNLYTFHGKHPVAEDKGGGWCYQDKDHTHNYRFRSPYMQRIAEKYYWGGGFDAEFRVYYPYFVHFFRDVYPLYYSEGQYLRNRATAPSIKQVPMPDEMTSWGPAPEPEPRQQAADQQGPRQSEAPAPKAIPSSMAAETTVIYASPPMPPPGYGYGYQRYGAAVGGYGYYERPQFHDHRPNNAPPIGAGQTPPPPQPPAPPPPSQPEAPRYRLQPIAR